jgi:hypothetical protein
MTATFILVLTLFGADANDSVYVVDYDMTAEDCSVRIEEQQNLLEKTFNVNDFVLTCEMDMATE